MTYEAKANEGKISAVDELVALIKEYPIVGTVNVEGLPTPQLQNMRSNLRGTVVLRVAKGRLIKRAIEQAKADKAGIEILEENLKGMPALLFTKDNPFKLFKTLKKNKSSAPAKAGQVAPNDIVVQAGPTSFAPGPIIGELGAFGIKTGVAGGKLEIKQDAVVAKEGEVISAGLAGILSRLGIEPMEVGLDLTAVYDEGTVYTKSVLDVDEDQIRAHAELFAKEAFNLAFNANIFVTETVELLLTKAASDARALAIETNI
ncbi:MAG: 50S ribosomal protein L10, partial [Candidatus Woesearchaeota archaeon]